VQGLSIRVGCCGFPVAKPKYYNSLKLVEINSTFYSTPKTSLVEKWRREAPEDFEFTVKAHKSISHIHRLEPTPECLEAYSQMLKICQTLRTRLLLIQTPASLRPLDETYQAAERLCKKVGGALRLLWETRGLEWGKDQARERLERLLRRYGVIHVTDPFLSEPVYVGEVFYARLHGLGKRLYYYQFSDEELKLLKGKVERNLRRGGEAYVLFNNLSMFDDALRFQTYLEKGELPPLTGAYGLESFRKVFQKTRFPTTLGRLRRYLGWRLFDVKPGKQSPVDDVLGSMPRKSFRSLEELVGAAEGYIGQLG